MNRRRWSALRAGATAESAPVAYPALLETSLAGIAAKDPTTKTIVSPAAMTSFLISMTSLSVRERKVRTSGCLDGPPVYAAVVVLLFDFVYRTPRSRNLKPPSASGDRGSRSGREGCRSAA